jgi:hypothetical protein
MDETRDICERARKLRPFSNVSVTKVKSRKGDPNLMNTTYSGMLARAIRVGKSLEVYRSDHDEEDLVMFTSSRVDRVFEIDGEIYVETLNSLYRLTVIPEVASLDQ